MKTAGGGKDKHHRSRQDQLRLAPLGSGHSLVKLPAWFGSFLRHLSTRQRDVRLVFGTHGLHALLKHGELPHFPLLTEGVYGKSLGVAAEFAKELCLSAGIWLKRADGL